MLVGSERLWSVAVSVCCSCWHFHIQYLPRHSTHRPRVPCRDHARLPFLVHWLLRSRACAHCDTMAARTSMSYCSMVPTDCCSRCSSPRRIVARLNIRCVGMLRRVLIQSWPAAGPRLVSCATRWGRFRFSRPTIYQVSILMVSVANRHGRQPVPPARWARKVCRVFHRRRCACCKSAQWLCSTRAGEISVVR